MSQTMTPPVNIAAEPSPRARSARWGTAAVLVAVAVAVYGAYGDPQPKADQEHAVPFICAVVALVAIGLFGLLVPAGLRGAAGRAGRWAGWGLGLGVLALLLTPVSFWSGLPVVLGTSAVLIGGAGRRAGARGLGGWAVGLGGFAAVAGVCLDVLGNIIPS